MNLLKEILKLKSQAEAHLDCINVIAGYLTAKDDLKTADFIQKLKEGTFEHPEFKAADKLPGEDLQLNRPKDGNNLFSKKELDKLPKLKEGKYRYKNGVHEIRFRRYGFNKSFSSTDKKVAKAKFKEFILELNSKFANPTQSGILFEVWAKKYLYDIKKPTVQPQSFLSYESTYNNHLLPAFEGRLLKDIKQIDIQMLFNAMVAKKLSRRTEYARTILKGIFETALVNKHISESPMQYLIIPKHKRKSGKALSLEEEKAFVQNIKSRKYELAALIMLYTGARKAEVLQLDENSFDFQNNIMICPNAKEKGINLEKSYRHIPIFPKLKRVLPDYLDKIKELKTISSLEFTRFFPEVCPGHTLHDLRHTFITRARECGVDRDVVSIWAGHKNSGNITNMVYTHFSAEFLKQESLKVDY